MKQVQFDYENADELKKQLINIQKICKDIPHAKLLFHILSDEPDSEYIWLICDVIDRELPDAMYVGCSTRGNIMNGSYNQQGIIIICTIYEYETTAIKVFQHEVVGFDIDKLNDVVAREIHSVQDAKSAEILLTASSISEKKLLRNYRRDLSDVKIYGGGALNVDVNTINTMVFSKGNKATYGGMVFVVVGGVDYNVNLIRVVGWKPLGKRFAITKSENNKLIELDNQPAFNAYSRYLNVENDEYFAKNTYEFPLLTQTRTGEIILKSPAMANADGSLEMFSSVEGYQYAQLAYGDPDTIMDTVYEAAHSLREMSPETISIFSCCARLSFWGDQASVETIPFQKVASTFGFYTSGELMGLNGNLEVHNETMVIAACREGEPDNKFVAVAEKKEKRHEYIPQNRRLMNFIGIATKELDENNRQLDELVKEIEAKRIEADRANMAKSDFLANMSHEIRTPINAILGFNTMILRETKDKSIIDYAVDIRNSGNNLLAIINEILDLSKIESGKMEIIPVQYSLANMIKDAVKMVSLKAEEKGLEVKLDIDPNLPAILYGDDIRIKQVIINLINNSIKYTNKGSVTLKINGTVNDFDIILHIAVIDTGVGIRSEDMDKLFEKFKRIEENRNRNIEGSGLGMNITAKLLSLMDSSLRVESEYGEGSTFYFDLQQVIVDEKPLGNISFAPDDEVETSLGVDYKSSFSAPGAKILLVDDNSMNRKVFINLLKKTEIQIDEADGGYKSLEMTAAKKYDMIFMDHMMPDLDGIETFKRMRASEDDLNRETPVIILTANAISGAREEYIDIGFEEFVSKPFNPEKIEELMVTYLPSEKVIRNKPGSTCDEPKEKVPLPEIDGIDIEKALKNLGDAEMVIEAMKMFATNGISDAAELRKLFDAFKAEQNDSTYDAFRIKVHSMKSSAAYIGATTPSSMARFLEFSAKDKRGEDILAVTEPFLGEWERTRKKVEEAVSVSAENKKPFDAEVFIEKIPFLNEAVSEMDIDRADDIMTLLNDYEIPDNLKEIYPSLQAAVSNIEVDTVDELCQKIVEILLD